MIDAFSYCPPQTVTRSLPTVFLISVMFVVDKYGFRTSADLHGSARMDDHSQSPVLQHFTTETWLRTVFELSYIVSLRNPYLIFKFLFTYILPIFIIYLNNVCQPVRTGFCRSESTHLSEVLFCVNSREVARYPPLNTLVMYSGSVLNRSIEADNE